MTTPPKQQEGFPEVAILRKGEPKRRIKKGDREIEVVGKDLGQKFRLHFLPGTDSIKAIFHSLHSAELVKYPASYLVPDGYELTTLQAVVPTMNVWTAWEKGHEVYQSGRRLGLADDTHWIYLRDPLDGNNFIVKNGEPLKAFEPKQTITYKRDEKPYELQVKVHGRLRLVLTDLMRQGALVQVTLKTTSFYDCENIQRQLAGIQAIADLVNNGNAGGVFFNIYRTMQSVTWNQPEGGAARVDKWFFTIQADPEWVKRAFARMSKNALTGHVLEQALLPEQTLTGEFNPELEEEEDGGMEEELPKVNPSVIDLTAFSAPEPPLEEEKKKVTPPASKTPVVRPLDPATLREMLIRKGHEKSGDASPAQLGLMVGVMDGVFAPDPGAEKMRRSCLRYLWGVGSSKELSGPQVKAALDWLKPVKDSGGAYFADPMAAKELKSVWTSALKESGQESLL